VGREVTFGLRPEHITSGRHDGETFVVPGRVMLVEPLGSDTLGLIRLGTGEDGGEMTGRFEPDQALRPGQSLPVALALEHFHLFDRDGGTAIRGPDW
jgi:multiple sugar transport system ATP-binding protein